VIYTYSLNNNIFINTKNKNKNNVHKILKKMIVNKTNPSNDLPLATIYSVESICHIYGHVRVQIGHRELSNYSC
jgi:hypothetical protein